MHVCLTNDRVEHYWSSRKTCLCNQITLCKLHFHRSLVDSSKFVLLNKFSCINVVFIIIIIIIKRTFAQLHGLIVWNLRISTRDKQQMNGLIKTPMKGNGISINLKATSRPDIDSDVM